jgi:hypothetical protein
VVAGSGLGALTWVLWGGLAVVLSALYIGIYVWMRRPRFGEDADDHASHDRQDETGRRASSDGAAAPGGRMDAAGPR